VRARIVTGTVPSSAGTIDYTHADISTWSTKGLALVFVSGNSALESEGGRISIGMVDQAGNQRMSACRLLQGRTTVSDDCVANHNDSVVRIIDDDPLPGAASWARAIFSSALTNGVRLNWNVVSGVSGRTFNVVVVLIDGLSQCVVGDGSGATTPNFEPDAVIGLGFNGSLGAVSAVQNNGHVTLGAAVDGSPIKQAAVVTAWDTGSEGVGHAIARNDVYGLDFTPPASQTEQVLDDFTATGFTDTGLGGIMWAAFLPNAAEPLGVALESLSGSGAQSFTGMGVSSQVLVGLITGNTSTNTIQGSGPTTSTTCLFVTDGTNTYSMSLAQRETGDITALIPSEGYSRYTSGSINMLTETGGTLFSATVTGVANGLQLSIATGMTGRMFLFGFGQGNQVKAHAETEDITDGAVLRGFRSLVVGEVVQISDGFLGLTNEIHFGADPAGTTFDAHASRGTALQGGAVAGTTLD